MVGFLTTYIIGELFDYSNKYFFNDKRYSRKKINWYLRETKSKSFSKYKQDHISVVQWQIKA